MRNIYIDSFKSVPISSAFIGFWLGLSLVSLVIMINYFGTLISVASINDLLPRLGVILFCWLVISIIFLSRAKNRINALNVSTTIFFVLYLIFVLPLTQLIVNTLRQINQGLLDILAFSVVTLIINWLFALFYLLSASSQQMAPVLKRGLFIFMVACSIAVTLINIVYYK